MLDIYIKLTTVRLEWRGARGKAKRGWRGAAKTANPAVRPVHGTAFATFAATRPGVSWTLRSPPHIASWRNTVEIHLLFPPTNHGKVAARTVLVAAFDALCIKSGVLYLDLDRSGGRGQVGAVFAKARTVGGASWAAWAAPWGRAGAGEKTRHWQKLGAPRGASSVGSWRRRAVGGGGGEKKGGGGVAFFLHWWPSAALPLTAPGGYKYTLRPPGWLQVHPPWLPSPASVQHTERQHASDAVDTSI